MKSCTKCGSLGPFPIDRSRLDGLHTQCKECHRVRAASRRAMFPSKTRACNAATMRRARDADPQASRDAANRWYAAHKNDPVVAAKRRARSRQWYLKHPERWIVYKFQRRARKAGAHGCASASQIRARIAFFGGKCAYCPAPYEHVDHVIALSRGGTNWPANLRPACANCNLVKHTSTWKAVQL